MNPPQIDYWAVLYNPRGRSNYRRLSDVCRDHLRQIERGDWPQEIVVAIARDLPGAQEIQAQIRRDLRKANPEIFRASEDAVETGSEDRKETP